MNPISTSIFVRRLSVIRERRFLLGIVIAAVSAVFFFSGASSSFSLNADPRIAGGGDSSGSKNASSPRIAALPDSGRFTLGVRDTSSKRDTSIAFPTSSVSRLQSASQDDSLRMKTASLPSAEIVKDSAEFKLGVRDSSAKRDSLIFPLRSFDFRFPKMSGIDSLASRTVPFSRFGSSGGRDLSSRRDTLLLLPKQTRDSIARADSIRRIPRDSTARIAQFLYHRTDSPIVSFFDQRTYSMFGKPPSLIIRTVDLDSTGQYVIIREMVNGQDIKIPEKIPLDEYVKLRYRYEINRSIEDEVHKFDATKKKNDLGDVLGSFTNIDIPIPANPVFSIFGPPKINLHISGAVDIHAAFTNTTTDQVTLSTLGNTTNQPDFSQEVQINVSGTIGDKLNILADWNTQRTFEYENQLKIKYTGYDDEIVQSVEAGNVSLATNSSFISNSSALFGIKTVFQFGPLKLTGIASQKKGQIQQKNITGGSSETDFTLHAYNYNTDHYFLDTSYIPLFENYYSSHQGDSDQSDRRL